MPLIKFLGAPKHWHASALMIAIKYSGNGELNQIGK